MKIPVKLTYLKGMLEKRVSKGDLLVIRSKFQLKETIEYSSGSKFQKVANEIEISLNVAGAALLVLKSYPKGEPHSPTH